MAGYTVTHDSPLGGGAWCESPPLTLDSRESPDELPASSSEEGESPGGKSSPVESDFVSRKRRRSSSSASASGDPGEDTLDASPSKVKRRAAYACSQCRTRKVRCDAVQKYPKQCSNCDYTGGTCEFQESRRRR